MAVKKNKKRALIALLLLACFILSPLQTVRASAASATGDATSMDISAGNAVITAGGTYTVTGSTTSHSIKINTDEQVTLTLDNVTIDLVRGPAISISGTDVSVELVGDNLLSTFSLKSNAVISGASKEGTMMLDIGGSGTLRIDSSGPTALKLRSTKLNISGGNVELTSDGDTTWLLAGGFKINVEGGSFKISSTTGQVPVYLSHDCPELIVKDGGVVEIDAVSSATAVPIAIEGGLGGHLRVEDGGVLITNGKGSISPVAVNMQSGKDFYVSDQGTAIMSSNGTPNVSKMIGESQKGIIDFNLSAVSEEEGVPDRLTLYKYDGNEKTALCEFDFQTERTHLSISALPGEEYALSGDGLILADMEGKTRFSLDSVKVTTIAAQFLRDQSQEASGETITVAATIEKLTVDGSYIVEPTLMTLPEGTSASEAIIKLLEDTYPDIDEPCRITGTIENGFYLAGIYDQDYQSKDQNYAGYLSEFDEGPLSGWMYSVGNSFPNVGAADYTLEDGDVMRWQYTREGLGADIGAGPAAWGGIGVEVTPVADKDALIRIISEINQNNTAAEYEGTYDRAMVVLRNIGSTQREVDSVVSVLQGNSPFTDVSTDDWFYEAVLYVWKNSIMSGVSGDCFDPQSEVTRAMLVKILHNMEQNPGASSENSFSDVPTSAWYASATAWAEENGLLTELVTDGLFRPDESVTREEFVTVLRNYAAFKGKDVSAQADISAYKDTDDISDWALEAMRWAVEEGLITGRGEGLLAPQGTATRAEVTTLFMRFLNNIMNSGNN